MKSFLNLFIMMVTYSSVKANDDSPCQDLGSGGYRVGQQSPLDLNSVDAASCDENSQLLFNNYDVPYGTPLILENNGHTADLKLEASSFRSISGGPLNDDIYHPLSLHLHWGKKNKCGSEHVMDGTCYSMELHLVHIRSDCQSLEEAIAKRKVAVLAFMFQEEPSLQTDHEGLAQLSRVLSHVQEYNSSIEVENFTLSLLVKNDKYKNYFSYPGSLTTPPFAEGVLWIVFKGSILASSQQMNKIRSLKNEFNNLIEGNNRALQPKNLRRVCHTSDNDDCKRNAYEVQPNSDNSYENIDCSNEIIVEQKNSNCNCKSNQNSNNGNNQNNGNCKCNNDKNIKNNQNNSNSNCNNSKNNHNNKGNGNNNNNNNCNCNHNQSN